MEPKKAKHKKRYIYIVILLQKLNAFMLIKSPDNFVYSQFKFH